MMITENVWREYRAKLRAFVRRRIEDHTIVDDILQDVFLKIYTRLNSLKEETNLESWLYQVTRNAVIDYYRSQKPSEELPAWISQPETNLNDQAKQDLEACLMPMINQLPAHYREALILSEIVQKPQKEVAKEQKISLSGAKSRVQRGRKLLKEMMLDCCQFEFDRHGQVIDYERRNKDCDAC